MNKQIVLNHKLNLNYDELLTYIEKINELNTNNDIIICPSFLYLEQFKKSCKYKIGSQNVSNQIEGNFTGEVSAKQLNKLNINYSLVGHSERRKHYYEDDNLINDKVINCLNNNIIPIICVGESLEDKNNGDLELKINNQISQAILGIDDQITKEVIIAYEPIWAIGSGITPQIEEIEYVINYIYDILKAYKLKPVILYGGSVNKNNIKDILSINNINGVLIGSISSKIDEIIKIINELN